MGMFFSTAELISIAELAVTVLGFVVLVRQVQHLREALRINAQGDLYARNDELRSLVAAHPEVRPYLFDGKPLPKYMPPDLRARVHTVAEMYLNYLEHLVIQKSAFRPDDWSGWEELIRRQAENSPIMAKIAREHSERYVPELCQLMSSRLD